MCPDLRLSDNLEQKLASDSAIDTRTGGRVVGDDAAGIRNHPGGPYTGHDVCAVRRPEPAAGGLVVAEGGLASPDATGLSDSSLVQLALSALAQNALVPVGKLRAVVRNAWLILEGAVDARIQRQAAEDAVKGLAGIRGVSNNILIESEVTAQRVSHKIEEAFVRSARLRASRISVTASNRKIILCGSVHSSAEREEAEAAAWAVPGVAHVVNRLRAIGDDS